MADPVNADASTNGATDAPLVTLGALGLPHRYMTRIYHFRREHEASLRERGTVDAKVKEKLRSACHALAGSIRGHLRLERARRGKINLSIDQELQIERSIERCERERERLLRELGLDRDVDLWEQTYRAMLSPFASSCLPTPSPIPPTNDGSAKEPAPTRQNANMGQETAITPGSPNEWHEGEK